MTPLPDDPFDLLRFVDAQAPAYAAALAQVLGRYCNGERDTATLQLLDRP